MTRERAGPIGLVAASSLLALVVPGLIAWTATFLVVPVRIFEGGGGGDALRRSTELTRGNRVPIFGVAAIYLTMIVVMLLCALGPLGVVEVWDGVSGGGWGGYGAFAAEWGSTELLAASVVVASVLQAVAQCFSTVAAAVIYFRLVPGALKLDADDIADVFT